MATAKYKAVKPFEENDVHYGIGMVLILDPKKATDLVETGKIRLEKYLDPEDAHDAHEIERFTGNPTGVPRQAAPVAAPAQEADSEESEEDAEDEDEADEKPADVEKDAESDTEKPADEEAPKKRGFFGKKK